MKQPLPSWIWNRELGSLREQYVRFRRCFSLDLLPEMATIQISADSRYRLYVNKAEVAFGPSRCYAHHQCVDVHDVTNYLRTGDNIIAILVYQPGYSHYSYIHNGKAGLWMLLEADEKQLLVSDSSWKASRDPSLCSNVRPISIYGGGQEHRDLRLAEPWTEKQFLDDHWEPATVCVTEDLNPWGQLQLAPLPNLIESIDSPQEIGVARGNYQADCDPHVELQKIFESRSTFDEKKRNLGTVELPAIGECDAHLLSSDFGSSRAGAARILIRGATGGEKVLISYVEKEVDNRPVLSDSTTYCQVRMTDQTILAPGVNELAPFSPRGGRYLLVALVGPCQAGLSLDISFRRRSYPLHLTHSIKPSDKLLQSVAEICWRTFQACALDGMVDCPWREQAAWVGDSAISASIIAQLCGEPLLLRRMLELAAQGATTQGLLPGVVVCDSDSTAIPAYSFAWVEGLSSYLEVTDDLAFVQQHWTVLSEMLATFQNDLNQDGLLIFQPGQRHFLDWAELPQSGPSCLYNLRYLYALQLATLLASRIGKDQDSEMWAGWASQLVKSIRQGFCRDETWYDNLEATSRSQHIAAFLTLTDLVTGNEARQVLDEALHCSLGQETSDLVLMSPYMHYYLFCAMEKLDRSDAILDVIKHRWGGWIDQGARTTWENWCVDFPDGSQCHAWSAHPLLFISRHAPSTNSTPSELVLHQPSPILGGTKES